ncbi:MAG: hypothetical protein ACLFUJ_08230, partial [Phycisphaerae bacterium]
VDDLIKQVQPEARFKDYRPDFHVVERTFVFQGADGPVEKTWKLVMDGQKYVALVRSGDFNLLALTPDRAKAELDMPKGRYHLDTLAGPVLTTHQFIQDMKDYKLQGQVKLEKTDSWSAGGRTITLTRRSVSPDREVTNTFVVAVDPVLGYTITGTYESAWSTIPDKRPKFGGWAFCPGNYTLWPETQIYERTVFSTAQGGYWGWANNLLAMDRVDGDRKRFAWRDNGLIAYLDKDTGFSPARTRSGGGGPTAMRLCNAHNDFHIGIDVLAGLEKQQDGKYHVRQVHRLVVLPPEITEHLWKNMTLYGSSGEKGVMIRIGQVEDFEDQPISVQQPVRGLTWTSGGPDVVSDQARSGKRSLLLTGRSWPNLPQLSLHPQSRYRLEAWMKVVALSDDEIAARREKHQARRSKALKQGKTPPAEKDWDNLSPAAWISADTYEWSPHSQKWLERMKTNTVGAKEDGWQKVTLEFSTGSWDPFVNIIFHAEDCKVYLDDFSMIRLTEPSGRQPG